MAVPATYNVTHYRGDTFYMVVRLWEDSNATVPADLSGAEVKSQLRPDTHSPDITADLAPVVSGNTITLQLTHTQAVALPASAVYDVQIDWLSDQSNVQTVLAGTFKTAPDVTRETTDPNARAAQ